MGPLCSLSFESILSIHCLAARDLGTGVEQPLSHPEVSGRAVHGEVDGWDTGGQHGQRFVLRHTHRPQRETITHLCKQERKRSTPVRRWPSRTQVVLGKGHSRRVGAGNERTESRNVGLF